MKKRNIIIGLVLTMALGIGVTAYAATGEGTGVIGQRLGLGRITCMNGQEYISDILKSKLGLSDADIKTALDSGKTLYDLAIEKGLTEAELKTALIEEKTKAIETAVSEGKITAEEGATLKENINENIQNCTGNFDGKQGQGRGQGGGMMGSGQGRSCR